MFGNGLGNVALLSRRAAMQYTCCYVPAFIILLSFHLNFIFSTLVKLIDLRILKKLFDMYCDLLRSVLQAIMANPFQTMNTTIWESFAEQRKKMF